jgi:hypothetical protein
VSRINQAKTYRRLPMFPMSDHAQRRAKDRSIPQAIIDAILDFGESRSAGQGAESYQLSRKGWKRFAAYLGHEAKHFERYRKVYVVVAPDGDVITACWQH